MPIESQAFLSNSARVTSGEVRARRLLTEPASLGV